LFDGSKRCQVNYTKLINRHNYICCLHCSKENLSIQEKDPKNYRFMPPCTLDKINAAGRPVKMSESVANLLR